MGLNNKTIEVEGENEKKFIEKINKVNAASIRIQKAYKSIKKRRQFYNTIKSINEAGAGAEKTQFLEQLMKFHFDDQQQN